jgi:hypothetical protein
MWIVAYGTDLTGIFDKSRTNGMSRTAEIQFEVMVFILASASEYEFICAA